jgi:hypothetical protein
MSAVLDDIPIGIFPARDPTPEQPDFVNLSDFESL